LKITLDAELHLLNVRENTNTHTQRFNTQTVGYNLYRRHKTWFKNKNSKIL